MQPRIVTILKAVAAVIVLFGCLVAVLSLAWSYARPEPPRIAPPIHRPVRPMQQRPQATRSVPPPTPTPIRAPAAQPMAPPMPPAPVYQPPPYQSPDRPPDDAPKDVYVEGYYRKDGTYVQPYWRRSPSH